MYKPHVLIVDDEEGMLEVCRDTLWRLPGVQISTEGDPLRALERLSHETVDLLICDIRMPKLDGVELLRAAREKDADTLILLMTAYPTVESAVEAMKLGASDYITKPFVPDDLRATVGRLLESKQLRAEKTLLQRQVERPYSLGEMVGESSAMRSVWEAVLQIAGADIDVLVSGETGTGKELVARSVHRQSSRSQGPFVPVDCAAIPEDLLESELFGREAGAFTGAARRSLGLLEFADGGTVFLDEIGELPMRLQAKLLRTLQERKIRRVGGTRETPINVRIVAATNRNLDLEVKEGRFRDDLYYRINVASIVLPPLREREGDVAVLAKHFIERFGTEGAGASRNMDPDALEILASYRWPGNVRQLQNVIKRALVISKDPTLSVNDLPDELVALTDSIPTGEREGFFETRRRTTDAFEREYLSKLLTVCRGEVVQAAKKARVPRGTFYRLLKKHGLTPEDFRS